VLSAVQAALLARVPAETAAPVTTRSFGLIGRSDAIQRTLSMIERLRQVDSTVLILGESGTGKEVVARAIHASSGRAGERFDAINCGAIPETLLESELFGHAKGAFTDAKTEHKGIFELCSKGTLMLDEIGDMPMILQTKLLRVLQERSVVPVGSNTPIPVNTRLLAATHRDILADMKSSRFRDDLYYRLSVVVLHLPPLRERKEDIPLLVAHFLERLNQRFGRSVRAPTGSVLERLMAYDWPGNVRELQNAVERAVGLATGDTMRLDDLFPPPGRAVRGVRIGLDTAVDREMISLPLTQAKQRFEKTYLRHLLQMSGGNVSETARISGRYRSDIYRLMHRHALEQEGFR
jgi:DNA-binding NtrC family response regulator